MKTSGVTEELAAMLDGASRVGVLTGARVIEVNPEQTDISLLCNVTLPGAAGEVLPQFLKERG